MSDSNPENSNALSKLSPSMVLAALGNPQRWQIFQWMLNGEELTINGLVTTTKRSYKAAHKDMDVLCAAGVVTWRFGADKRVGLFFIPAEFRPQPGLVDFGFARFGMIQPRLAKD
jgi:predicted transcriptional regulator